MPMPALSRRTLLTMAAGALSARSQATGQTTPPEWLTIAEAAALIRRRRLSPVELLDACLKRTEALNPRLNAYITLTADAARDAARAAEAEIRGGRWRGPLHGIPIALKDLYDTAGVRTTAGSAQWKDRVPAADAAVVQRLKTAGAVLTGKANMDEFAYDFAAESSHFGAARNPFDPARTPGGSSGGSAVAVAAGMCLAALGSDTGGSIRLPASFCGVTGWKPTYGQAPLEGVAPLAWSLDHAGPLCRTAEDAALVHAVLSARPVPLLPPARRLRVGVPRRVFFDDIEAPVAAAIDEALRLLPSLCAGVGETVLPEFPTVAELGHMPADMLTLVAAEAYTFHQDMLARTPALYSPGIRASIENGASVPTPVYIRARRAMEHGRATIAAAFGTADVLVTPAATGPAFRLGEPRTLIHLRNFAPWNLYGAPAMVVPCGATAAGLPLGMQIIGKPGREDQVYALAQAWQQATDWHRRRPPLA